MTRCLWRVRYGIVRGDEATRAGIVLEKVCQDSLGHTKELHTAASAQSRNRASSSYCQLIRSSFSLSSVLRNTSTQASRSFCFIPAVMDFQRSSAKSEKPVFQLRSIGGDVVVVIVEPEEDGMCLVSAETVDVA